MKYEAVFGSQVWFEHQNNEYVVAFEITHDDESTEIQFDTEYPKKLKSNETIIAMRRIIKEPKHWTWEDKKAGRLPDVGSIVKFGKSKIEFLGVGEISNYWVCRYPSGVFAFRERGSIEPIETPAEKAQRLENEWVNKAWSETAVFDGVAQDEHDRLRIHLRHIYKAQLSGELQAPKGGE